ncbi:MAG: metallophosphoesterase [Gammaproteobacteria bacterium]
MKIGILSDSHDHTQLLLDAAHEAITMGVEAFLHCGDLVEAETVAELASMGRPVHLVHGNNSGNLDRLRELADRAGSGIHYYGAEADFTLAGRRIFLSHYPERARAMAATGQWDLLCCGHSHRSEIVRIDHERGTAVLLNPGTVAGIGAPANYAWGSLETLQFEIRSVSGRSGTPAAFRQGTMPHE